MRNEWKAKLKVSDILAAAQAKQQWHEGRLKFWTDARDNTEAEIKSSGLTIEKSVAAGYNSTGRAPTVTIDSTMLADMNECNNKINEHNAKEAEYTAWVQFLTSCNQDDMFELAQSDWLYFYSQYQAPSTVSGKFGSA